jgi:pimeloyl-ACP methyl ester carboxylesterase
MPTITVNQQRLFYARQGKDEDTPQLVLIHGAGGSRLSWPAPLRRMPHTAVYALDLPGHGRSPPPGRTAVDAYADDVQAFMATLELDDVVLVGHSMGGAIAQTLGLRGLPQLRGLVLIGTGARLRVTEEILDQILTDFESAVVTVTWYAWPPQAPQVLRAKGREMLVQIDPKVLHGDYVACDNFDVMDKLNDIEVPTLVMTGTADQLTPVKYGRYLAHHIPQAQFVPIEGGGHMVALEQPDEVAAAVTAFIQDTVPNT